MCLVTLLIVRFVTGVKSEFHEPKLLLRSAKNFTISHCFLRSQKKLSHLFVHTDALSNYAYPKSSVSAHMLAYWNAAVVHNELTICYGSVTHTAVC